MCLHPWHTHPLLSAPLKKRILLYFLCMCESTCQSNHAAGYSHWHSHVPQSVLFQRPLPPLFLTLRNSSLFKTSLHISDSLSPFSMEDAALHQAHAMSTNSSPASATSSSSSSFSSRSWSISEDSLRRYVTYASESCIQELLSASDAGGGAEGWKVLAFDNGVEISKRCSGSLHVFRSRWLLRSVSPQQFIAVANAIDAAKQWDAGLAEAEYIKDLDDNLSIIRLRFGDSSKPLFKKREFIVYERRETMDDGTLVVAVASLPKKIAAGLCPKKSNLIRGLLLHSGWVVEKLDDDSCMVTYVVQLDPAGWLPKCFVNRLNTKLVMIIDNLRKLAQTSPVNS